MKNSKLLTATAVFSVAVTAAVTTMSLTAAYRGNGEFETGQGLGNKPTQVSEEQRDSMHEALENRDYEAWIELIPENSRMSDFNETEFIEFAEEQLEKIEEMETRREEMETQREAIETALENLDYEAWYEIMKENERNAQLLEVINADNFDQLLEIHNLRQEGQEKFEEAKELAEDLGIEQNRGDKLGKQGMGMHQEKRQDVQK